MFTQLWWLTIVKYWFVFKKNIFATRLIFITNKILCENTKHINELNIKLNNNFFNRKKFTIILPILIFYYNRNSLWYNISSLNNRCRELVSSDVNLFSSNTFLWLTIRLKIGTSVQCAQKSNFFPSKIRNFIKKKYCHHCKGRSII